MELQIGVYTIPKGCTIKREDNVVRVYQKKKDKLSSEDYRCKDCKHFISGYTGFSSWATTVCDAKPKKLSEAVEGIRSNDPTLKDRKIYYSAQKYGLACACKMFELKIAEDEK